LSLPHVRHAIAHPLDPVCTCRVYALQCPRSSKNQYLIDAALVTGRSRAPVANEATVELGAERVAGTHADAVVAKGIDAAHHVAGIVGAGSPHGPLAVIVVAPAVVLAGAGDPICPAKASNGSSSRSDQEREDSNVELHCEVVKCDN
jgi:hypothetical protein